MQHSRRSLPQLTRALCTLTLAMALLAAGPALAQSGAKLTKVLLVSDAGAATVPANAVWKIEGFFVTLKDASRHKEYMVELATDGKTLAIALNNPNPGLQMQFPLWLSAGTKVTVKFPGLYLSVVEYSIAP